MRHLLLALVLLAPLATTVGCGSGEATCAPGERSFKFCDGDELYTCPVGTQEQLDQRKELVKQCTGLPTEQLVKCVAELPFEHVPALLTADCGVGGMECVEDLFATPPSASCEKPR